MTKDEIAQAMQDTAGNSWGDEAHFQRFAALVSDAEAKRIHEDGMVTLGHMREQIAAEREECAKECDIQASWGNVDERFGARQCSHAIRSRGQKMT